MIEVEDLERIKYLINKAMKYGLSYPDIVLVYLRQQGYEDITLQEVADRMTDIMSIR